MSTKKIHLDKAPSHDLSLADAEIESRSNLVTPKTGLLRQKKKEIEDPRLGPDMTQKILKSAVNQIVEEKRSDDDDVDQADLRRNLAVSLNNFEDTKNDNDEDDIEIDLETNDDESKQLFEMFKSSIAHEASHHLDHTLLKTRHQVDPQVQEVYKKLGTVLKTYKSGKLPKAINVVASQKIPDWEDLIDLSNPLNWSPNAMEAVTVLFSQTASDKRLTKYIQDILFEYIQNTLETAKRLPRPVWNALMAAARRPPCFIKGLLLPLSLELQVSMKEAKVISAIVTKVKLPRDHMNALLIKICENPISPVRTIFISKLISKGQALAIQAIDAVFAYFMQFLGEDDKQPLMWHKSLLDFVKRYGVFLNEEQREALEPLLQKHKHDQITKEIRDFLSKNPPVEEGEYQEENIPTY